MVRRVNVMCLLYNDRHNTLHYFSGFTCVSVYISNIHIPVQTPVHLFRLSMIESQAALHFDSEPMGTLKYMEVL